MLSCKLQSFKTFWFFISSEVLHVCIHDNCYTPVLCCLHAAFSVDGLTELAHAISGIVDDDDELADDAVAMHTQRGPYGCTQQTTGVDSEAGDAVIDADEDQGQGEFYETTRELEETENAVAKFFERGLMQGQQVSTMRVYPWERPGITPQQRTRSMRNFRYRVRKRILGLDDLFTEAAAIPGSDDCYFLVTDTGRANGTSSFFVGARSQLVDEQTKQNMQKLIVLLWSKHSKTREYAAQLLTAALYGHEQAEFMQGIAMYVQHSYRLVQKGFMSVADWEKQCMQYEETLQKEEEVKCARDTRAKMHLQATTGARMSLAESSARSRKVSRVARMHAQPKTVAQVEELEEMRRRKATQKKLSQTSQQQAADARQPLENRTDLIQPVHQMDTNTPAPVTAAAVDTTAAVVTVTPPATTQAAEATAIAQLDAASGDDPAAAPPVVNVAQAAPYAQPSTIPVSDRLRAGTTAVAAVQDCDLNVTEMSVHLAQGLVNLNQKFSVAGSLHLVRPALLKAKGASGPAAQMFKVC